MAILSRMLRDYCQVGLVVIAVLICVIYSAISLGHRGYLFTSSTASDLCTEHDAHLHYVSSPSAKCIDGSPPAYYFRRGKVPRWHIHFEGGGWCYSIPACYERSFEQLGSSITYPKCVHEKHMKDYLSQDSAHNPLMANWNHVLVKYCDGASYAGDAIHHYNDRTLFFKGKFNRDETIKSLLFEYGMKYASDVVISGCSAGGLGIFLGIDQMTSIIHSVNSSIQVKAIADSGFFLDYSSDDKWISENKYPEALVGNKMDYSKSMKNVFDFANVSSGANPKCIQNAASPSSCIFAQNLAIHISTPLFALQVQLASHS